VSSSLRLSALRASVVLGVSGVIALAACATPTRPAANPAATGGFGAITAEAPAGPSIRPGPRFAPAVQAPLDARGIAPCSLLTAGQLVELGLDPDTARPATTGQAKTCGWTRRSDTTNPAGLQINTDPAIPSLDGIYIIRDTFSVFAPTEVSGHPAVRADGALGTGCTLYTAIADYQAVATGTNLAGRPLADPCAGARRMAEMILSNLPPLR
jgi:hypothetical protein